MAQGGKHLVAAKLNLRLKHDMVGLNQEQRDEFVRTMLSRLALDPGTDFTETPECRLAFRKYLLSSSKHLSQSWRDLYIDDYSLFSPVTNKEDEDMAAHMTRADVRRALHVEETPIDTWPYPEAGFDYTKEYDACNERAAPDAWSMIDFYRDIVPRLKTTLIYNGDTDPCVRTSCGVANLFVILVCRFSTSFSPTRSVCVCVCVCTGFLRGNSYCCQTDWYPRAGRWWLSPVVLQSNCSLY